MDRTKTRGLTAACAALAVCALTGAATGCEKKPRPIVVGSKNFTEQVLLGEIIAQHLENRLGRKVIRQFNLGGTLLTYQALLGGQISLYPEYTGTIEAEILKEKPSADPQQVLLRSRQEMRRVAHIEVFDPLGIDNFFAMVIRGDDARKYKLETLSQAAQVKEGWKLGMGYEFETRIDGMPSLEEYHLKMNGPPRSMDLGLMYKALDQGQVTMIAANATDGPLATHDWKVLQDDKHTFGSYQACVIAREDALAAEPRLQAALAELSGKLNNQQMRRLNAAVDVEHRPVRDVASEFLSSIGLATSGAR